MSNQKKVSKADLTFALRKHEERETEEQEEKESAREQQIEEDAGLHEKKGFWAGFLEAANR